MRENVRKARANGCLVYTGALRKRRHLTTIPIPAIYFNQKKQWLPEGRYMKWHTCKACAFYLSTGTSNEGANFPGMWFPFMRMQEQAGKTMPRGWLSKAYGLEGSSLQEKLAQIGIEQTPFLFTFFEKFSYWWQISMSAALPSRPDSLWNVHPELRKVRDAALMYVYDRWDGFARSDQMVQEYLVPECEERAESPEAINAWLGRHNSLCAPEDWY